MVNSESSFWANVLSGILLESILGPFLLAPSPDVRNKVKYQGNSI